MTLLRCCLQEVRTQCSGSASNPCVLLHSPAFPFGIKAVPSRNSTRVFNQQQATARRGAQKQSPLLPLHFPLAHLSAGFAPHVQSRRKQHFWEEPSLWFGCGCGSAEPAWFRTWLGLACGMLSEGPSVSCSSLQDNYAEVEQARGWRGAAAHLELKDLHIWYIQYLLKVTATLPFGWRPGAPRIAQRIKIHSCIFFF